MAWERSWREHYQTIMKYPFEQLEVNRVTARVKADNAKGLKLVKELNFKHEGTIREALDGQDVLIFGLLKREFDGKENT